MKRILTVVAATLIAASATAQSAWPSKPVKLIVPFTAGSITDIMARTIAESLSKNLGQPVIIENKPGAGGTIGAAQVAKSEPDGYTVLIVSSGHVLNPAIYPSLPYDTVKDLTGVTPIAAVPNVLLVSPARGWKTVGDMLAAAKARPGQMNYASAGTGSATHMNAEKFKLQAGIDAQHIPFKGTPEAMTDVIGGRNDWVFAPMAAALPLVKDGKVQALAVSSPQRSSSLPNVPTTVEAGVPGSDYTLWVGMIVPSATPAAIVKRLHEETLKAIASPEVKARLAAQGAEAFTLEPAAFNAFIKTEMESAAVIAKTANLKAQ